MIALANAAALDAGVQTTLLGAVRVMSYLGVVLLVGPTFFMTWLWPEGRTVRTFSRLIVVGAALTVVSALALPVVAVDEGWSSYAGREGAWALARVGLVSIGLAFSRDVLGSARSWRLPITLWQLALIETFVLSSNAVGEPWQLAKIIATTGHIAATAAWLGGLLTLAAILLPSTDLGPLHDVLPRFSYVAIGSVVMLFASGLLHAWAIAGGWNELIDSDYGVVLLVKVVVIGAMLALGNIGRRYAESVGRRKLSEIDESAPPESVQAFAVAVGAEFALAVGVLVATAALVHVAP